MDQKDVFAQDRKTLTPKVSTDSQNAQTLYNFFALDDKTELENCANVAFAMGKPGENGALYFQMIKDGYYIPSLNYSLKMSDLIRILTIDDNK